MKDRVAQVGRGMGLLEDLGECNFGAPGRHPRERLCGVRLEPTALAARRALVLTVGHADRIQQGLGERCRGDAGCRPKPTQRERSSGPSARARMNERRHQGNDGALIVQQPQGLRVARSELQHSIARVEHIGVIAEGVDEHGDRVAGRGALLLKAARRVDSAPNLSMIEWRTTESRAHRAAAVPFAPGLPLAVLRFVKAKPTLKLVGKPIDRSQPALAHGERDGKTAEGEAENA